MRCVFSEFPAPEFDYPNCVSFSVTCVCTRLERIQQRSDLRVQVRAFGDRFLKRFNVGFEPLRERYELVKGRAFPVGLLIRSITA